MTRSDEPLSPAEAPAGPSELLSAPDVGLRVVRGGALRIAGYGLGMIFTAAASVLLLRHLGVVDFGRYMTVASLLAIVGGVTDAGLTAVGARDLTQRQSRASRVQLLGCLIGLRLVITPIGVVAALLFAFVAGYERALVIGTALAGIALVLTSVQGSMALPLAVDLRIRSLTILDVARPAALLVGIALLVAGDASLLPFLALYIPVAALVLLLTPLLVGRPVVWRPTYDRVEWRSLAREALPVAASVVAGVFYFRLLIVLMSLVATALATGLFATSFRIVEILYGVSALLATTLLPVLAAAADDRRRLGYILQRMIEVGMIAACYLIVLVAILAVPILDILGGSPYRAAAPALRIQVFALIPVFAAHSCQLALIAIRKQGGLVIASGLALVAVLALGSILSPRYGATGAAAAALGAEAIFATAICVLLGRADQTLLPSPRPLWKPGVAAATAGLVATFDHLPAFGSAVAASVAFSAVLLLTRAIPPEVLDAMTGSR